MNSYQKNGVLAHLARAYVLQAEGGEFDPHTLHFNFGNVAKMVYAKD